MKQVVALVGLSGVGKSTLVGRISARLPLLHLQASGLIKAEQAHRKLGTSSSEELRLGPILDNQRLLIDGFARATKSENRLIVFDGHVVIFGLQTATEIPSSVFAALGCRHIVMVRASPKTICDRRAKDLHRVRPNEVEDVIAWQQRYAENVAARIAAQLGVRFECIDADDPEKSMKTLSECLTATVGSPSSN